MSAWIFLAFAIALEVVGTLFLKMSDGFAKWHYGALSMLFYFASIFLLAPALKSLPVGVVYAIWAGIGIVAAGMIGYFAFGEKLATIQVLCIAMVLCGAIGLRLTTSA